MHVCMCMYTHIYGNISPQTCPTRHPQPRPEMPESRPAKYIKINWEREPHKYFHVYVQFIYIVTHIHKYIYIYIYVYIYKYLCRFICIHVYIYIYIYI